MIVRAMVWWLFFCLLIGGRLAWHEYMLLPDGKVHIAFLDVGQGDSALITTPKGKHILIDGGPDFSTLEHLGTRLSFFDRTIDVLVLTHPHLDHIASLPAIVERYHVSRILFSGIAYPQPRYDHLLQDIQTQKTNIVRPQLGETIDLQDGVTLTSLWPPYDWFGTNTHRNPHDATVVLKLRYKEHSALFMGDLETKYENEILKRQENVRADILKVGHHGSLTSTSTGFLLAVAPHLAILSVGSHNAYGLPKQAIVSRIEHFGIPIKRTDEDGTVEVVWQ